MSMIVKVQPGTPFIPAGMPGEATPEECQVRPCPLEIEARQVNGPYWVGGPDDGSWVVDIVPVDGDSEYPGYYSSVDASKITIDERSMYVVHVAEVHVTDVPLFTMDPNIAMGLVRNGCVSVGDFPSRYSHTIDDGWTVSDKDGNCALAE